MSEPIYHLHHIIPRHAGGTDDPSNLIRLSIEEHAEAHRLLWEEHGRLEDKCAWLLLANLVDEGNQIRAELARNAVRTPEYRAKKSELAKQQWNDPDIRRKMSDAQKARYENVDERMKTGDVMRPIIQRLFDNNPDYRMKISTAAVKRYQDPSERRKTSDAVKAKWENPTYRDQQRSSKLGSNNPNFGKHWITNGNENALVLRTTHIPSGWCKGRTRL